MIFIEVPYFKYQSHYKMWAMLNKSSNIRLKVYDGIDGSHWNGGRIQEYSEVPQGISVSFALTRHDNINLKDNDTMKVLKDNDKKGNSIILSSMKLLNFLKTKLHNYTYIYSITAYDISNGYDGYRDIENNFDYIVPRNEIFKDIENFKNLNNKKYIALNSFECSDCPLYNEHYRVIGNLNKDQAHLAKCWMKNNDLLKEMGYDKSQFDYKYTISNRWYNNIMKVDGLAGYKIGRNEQSWEAILDELDTLVSLIIKKSDE